MNEDEQNGGARDEDSPSRSARKRAHRSLQELGVTLMGLTRGQLQRVPLEQDLREAVEAGRDLRKGARARHVRHLGNLLSHADVEAVRAAVDAVLGAGAREAARLHRAERWRERLLEPGDGAVHDLVARYPGLDRQRLRALVRGARAERERELAPRRFRELLRFLRDLEENGE